MSDTVVTENTQVASTPETPIHGNPGADAARRALYERHYGTTAEDTSTTPPAAETSSTTDSASTAQVDQTSATAGTSTAASEDQTSAQLVEVLRAMQAEIAALKAAAAAPPVATSTATTSQVEAPWVTALRNGDIEGAERAMAEAVAKRVQDKLEKPLVEQAESRTVERMQALNEIESFVKDLRTNNSDLLEMESWITLDAQQRLAAVQSAGTIKTTGDAVREYKKAVLEATESARKVAQKLRGSGKNEAMTRNREVLSATTLAPNQVDANRGPASNTPAEPQAESIEGYFEKRKAAETARRGLAV